MCLITYNKGKIAEKPIKVYKIMRLDKERKDYDYFFPIQREKGANIGDTVKASVDNEPKTEGILETQYYVIHGEGVHAYVTYGDALKSWVYCYICGAILTEWEIPAGAKYWDGDYYNEGEIAATEMKFIKACK